MSGINHHVPRCSGIFGAAHPFTCILNLEMGITQTAGPYGKVICKFSPSEIERLII